MRLFIARLCVHLSFVTFVVLLSGCAYARYGMMVVGGHPTEPARYVPEKKPLAVVVKELPDPMGARLEGDEIAGLVEQQFEAFEVAPIVPVSKIADLRSASPADFSTMTAAQIGKAVGAEQVLNIEIVESRFDSEATSDMLRGKIGALVRVINTADGKYLWPTDGSRGSTVIYETGLLRLNDRNSAQSIERDLHVNLAEKIGRLFRDYKPD
jgi:hypothetical protein